MIIGLDYDGTITLHRSFWVAVYYLARACGVEIVVVTMRYDTEEEGVYDFPAMIYYTERKAKKPFMEALGIKIDVWIDDNPNWIFEDSA